MVHNIRDAQKRRDKGRNVLLWTFARNTAWRHVCAVMQEAGIEGPHAMPTCHACASRTCCGRSIAKPTSRERSGRSADTSKSPPVNEKRV